MTARTIRAAPSRKGPPGKYGSGESVRVNAAKRGAKTRGPQPLARALAPGGADGEMVRLIGECRGTAGPGTQSRRRKARPRDKGARQGQRRKAGHC